MKLKTAVKPFVSFNYYGGRPHHVPDEVAELAKDGLDHLALQRFSKNYLLIDNVSSLSSVAAIYRAHGKPHRASLILEHALSLKPQSASLHRSYGETLLAMSNPGGAMDVFESALHLAPGHPKTQALYGLAMVLKGQEEKSEERTQQGLQLLAQVQSRKPGRPDLAALRSRALLQTEHYEEAIAFADNFSPRRITTQIDCELVASVHVNAGMAHMALADKGVPMVTGNGSRYGAAVRTFDRASEWVRHLQHERSQARGDDKLFNRLSRRSQGYNGHSHKLLMRIAGFKLIAAEKGKAPTDIKSHLKADLKEMTAIQRRMHQRHTQSGTAPS